MGFHTYTTSVFKLLVKILLLHSGDIAMRLKIFTYTAAPAASFYPLLSYEDK